ncbi:prophage regulatory protein [Nitrosomonas nitrosa]|uniref:helix-turn-helix transcriptional regulator n=1 Tax=Nitrosomonas nitrosa TaxID=52442 RepID=UPI000D31FEC4|nr:transcriptional regulator [Nitrosomonas nitrosa]PTQ88345.1 prophage regulatory protein [Nitrosomonas nitrosa]
MSQKQETSPKAFFLKKPVVLHKTSMGHAWLYEAIRKRKFISPVKVGKASLWPADEVELMCKAMAAGLDEEELKSLVIKIEAARKNFSMEG